MLNTFYKIFVLSCIIILYGQFATAQTQIIINEFSQGPSDSDNEWIELGVIAIENNQGVYFDKDADVDSDEDRWNEIHVQLSTTHSAFSSVTAGAIIVIYKDTPNNTIITPDLDFSDNVLIIPHTNETHLMPGATWPSLLSGGDEFGIFNSDGSGIHGITYGLEGLNHQSTWSAAFPSGIHCGE